MKNTEDNDTLKNQFSDSKATSLKIYSVEIEDLITKWKALSGVIEYQLKENSKTMKYVKQSCECYIQDLQAMVSRRSNRE